MLAPGQLIELAIEKPAAGGRMIARHDGQIVLVLGAIPGEKVRAQVERVERTLAFALTIDVLDRSADRRDCSTDLLCGGCLYSHIAYPKQRAIKSEVIADAFTRIGRISLDEAVVVAPSPEEGYRLRARMHVRDNKAGFYREGTHDLCDVAQTRQLLDASVNAVADVLGTLQASHVDATSIELTESISGDQRAIHVELHPGTSAPVSVLQKALGPLVTGCMAQGAGGALSSVGDPTVGDSLDGFTAGRARGALYRHVRSFFQANRYLLPSLVTTVLNEVPADGNVLDLYAGVGLFSVALAGSGRDCITAVEGDRSSATDLQRNANQFGAAIRVVVGSVESYLAGTARRPPTIIVDPPRTGLSKQALRAMVGQRPRVVIYVSCDPPTMARDGRGLIDGGYRLKSLCAFDLFPNTPHVETVGVFLDEKGR